MRIVCVGVCAGVAAFVATMFFPSAPSSRPPISSLSDEQAAQVWGGQDPNQCTKMTSKAGFACTTKNASNCDPSFPLPCSQYNCAYACSPKSTLVNDANGSNVYSDLGPACPAAVAPLCVAVAGGTSSHCECITSMTRNWPCFYAPIVSTGCCSACDPVDPKLLRRSGGPG